MPRPSRTGSTIDWSKAPLDHPEFLGTRVLKDYPLADLIPYIDWSPFFSAWELKGKYPRIFEDPTVGPEARKLFDDAQAMLARIVSENLLTAHGVFGFYPANSDGDDIVIFTDDTRKTELARLPMLRQQWQRQGQSTFRSLSDYIAPISSGLPDYLGAFAVTAGQGADDLARQFEADHDDYSSILAKALADRLAEAFAERLHKSAREAWTYGRNESLSHDDLVSEKYQGIRPAPGYPACPDHTLKPILWDLLNARESTGIWLTDSLAMVPAASVSGLYFSHPDSRYFAVDMITRDQVESYAKRFNRPLADTERWLSPNLAYDPLRK